MHFSLRKLLFAIMLGLAMVVASTAYAQVSDDPCECCTFDGHDLMCSTCKVCYSPGLVSQPIALVALAEHEDVKLVQHMSASKHIEDIWHPPKYLAS